MEKRLNNSDLSEILEKLDRLTARITWQLWLWVVLVAVATVLGQLV